MSRGRDIKHKIKKEIDSHRELARRENTNKARELLSSLGSIPSDIKPELEAFYDPELGLLQVTYSIGKEGRNTKPSTAASEERGKIYDPRTGAAICGGSTFTHLAIASNNSLKVSGNTIILEEVVDVGVEHSIFKKTGKIFEIPKPAGFNKERQVISDDISIKERLADVEDSLNKISHLRVSLEQLLNEVDSKIFSLQEAGKDIDAKYFREKETLTREIEDADRDYNYLSKELERLEMFLNEESKPPSENDFVRISELLSIFEELISNDHDDPETKASIAEQRFAILDEIGKIIGTEDSLIQLLKSTEDPSEKELIINKIRMHEEKSAPNIEHFRRLIYNISLYENPEDYSDGLDNSLHFYYGKDFDRFFIGLKIWLSKKDIKKSLIDNLAIDETIRRGNQTLIRYYAEGTHVYIYKFNGKVRFATHKNPKAGYYDGEKFTGKARYYSAPFAESYIKMGGPEPKRLFPEDCLTSPYVYRFLICTPDSTNISRLSVGNLGFLVFVGVHKMWNDGDKSPYKFVDDPHDRRPYAGNKDTRTVKELLDLKRYTNLEVSDSLLRGATKPYIYYPRSSYNKASCEKLLQEGIYEESISEKLDRTANPDKRLDFGEALMVTYFYTEGGKRHIRNVKVMSESYAFRLTTRSNGRSISDGLLYYSMRSKNPKSFDKEIPPIKQASIDSLIKGIIIPFNEEGVKNFLSRPPALDKEEAKRMIYHNRSVASAIVYIYTCNANAQVKLVNLLAEVCSNKTTISEFMASHLEEDNLQLNFQNEISDMLASLFQKIKVKKNELIKYTFDRYYEAYQVSPILDEVQNAEFSRFAAREIIFDLDFITAKNIHSMLSGEHLDTNKNKKKFLHKKTKPVGKKGASLNK